MSGTGGVRRRRKQSTGLFPDPPHPFGGVHVSTGSPPNARFPGQWFQSESGLHQNWMRNYDPTTGRYLQADPLGLVDGASVYGYVRQSPMMFTDPTGECPVCVAGALFALGLLYDILSDEDGCVEPIELAYYVFSNVSGWKWVKWATRAAGGGGGPSPKPKPKPTPSPRSEPTPDTNPELFDPVRGTSAKKNKETGEVWEKDKLHKDHYEVYKDKKAYEKGRRDRDVWDDGRPKGPL
jgi:RHS repeat-associated protein